MSRYADDLRKIVGVDEVKKELKELENKASLDGRRGIGYQSLDKAVRSSSGSTNSGTGAPTNALGTAPNTPDATNDALEGTSSSETPSGGDTPNKLDTDGNESLSDLIDSLSDRGLSSSIPAAPNLSAINGWTDPTTGKSGTVRLDGMFSPPTTWSDADTPPEEDGWVLGTRWVVSGTPSGTVYGATPSMAGEAAAADLNASPPIAGDVPYVFTGLSGSGMSTVAEFSRSINGPFTLPDQPFACTAGTDVSCPLTAPVSSSWPITGAFQVVRNEQGNYVGNPYDSEVPSIYAQPISTVYMEFGASRTAVLTAGTHGTRLLYETNPANGQPLAGGILHVYDSNNQLQTYAPIADISKYTP